MVECTTCNLCDNPGTIHEAREQGKVFSHVKCFSKDSFTVWRCVNCRSLHSKESVDLPRYYADYPFKNHRLDFHTYHGYSNRIRMLREAGVTEKDLILDFGCGAGLFVQFLQQNGFHNAQGFDPFIASYSNEAVLQEKYDVVVSYDVIEHVDEPKEFFKRMVSLAKPEGKVVIGTPNASELSVSRAGGNTAVELSQPYHRHILSEEIILSLADRYGLTPEAIHRRFYFDTLVPTVNTKFMWAYINANGGMIDVAVEKLKIGMVLRSPKLMFYALFGYFFRVPGNILITFKNKRAKGGIQDEPLAYAA